MSAVEALPTPSYAGLRDLFGIPRNKPVSMRLIKLLEPENEAELRWLMADPYNVELWKAREAKLVSAGVRDDPNQGWLYWVMNYGVIQPKTGGPLQAFKPYGWQECEYFPKLGTCRVGAFVKPRQGGGTTGLCHYYAWNVGIAEDTYGADFYAHSLTLDKHAKKLLKLTRQILIAQPDWIRPAIGAEAIDPISEKQGVDQTTMFSCPERSTTFYSLAFDESGRGGASRISGGDEAAYIIKGDPDTIVGSILPASSGGGQAIFVSTGNGDENGGGQGQAFAKLARMGERGENGVTLMFIPRSQHEGFNQAEYDLIAAMKGQEFADQEWPETLDQALMGNAEGKAYSSIDIAAAVDLGARWDAMPRNDFPRPLDGELIAGIDWGLNSSGVVVYPMPNHGFYIAAETTTNRKTTVPVSDFTLRVLALMKDHEIEAVKGGSAWFGKKVKAGTLFYDSTGSQEYGYRPIVWSAIEQFDPEMQAEGIDFSQWKGKTVDFLKVLLRRTGTLMETHGDQEGLPNEPGWIAISPECKQLLAELRKLEVDDAGKIIKGDDHTHDALLTALAWGGARWRDEFAVSA